MNNSNVNINQQNASNTDVFAALKQESQKSDTDSLEALGKELQREKDGRREERFIFILVIVILLNITVLPIMSHWSGPIALLILQFLLLILLCNKDGIKRSEIICLQDY